MRLSNRCLLAPHRCQELSETLLELGVDCTPLHSLLGQRRRMAALGKFKSQQVKFDIGGKGMGEGAVCNGSFRLAPRTSVLDSTGGRAAGAAAGNA